MEFPHGLDSGHGGAEDSLAVASSHQDSQGLAQSSAHHAHAHSTYNMFDLLQFSMFFQ